MSKAIFDIFKLFFRVVDPLLIIIIRFEPVGLFKIFENLESFGLLGFFEFLETKLNSLHFLNSSNNPEWIEFVFKSITRQQKC